MKKLSPLFLMLLMACSKPSEQQEMKDTTTNNRDTVSAPANQETKTSTENMNILAFHKYLQASPLHLNHNEDFRLPELREEDGKISVYDPAYEEPVDQASLSPASDSLSYTSGDYTVTAVQLPPCNSTPYAALLVSEVMGSFQSYTLKVYKMENGKWSDATGQAIDLKNPGNLTTVSLGKDDYQYKLNKNSVTVMLNPGKVGPAYLESNPEDPIAKTTEEERDKKVSLSWSTEQCKFVLK